MKRLGRRWRARCVAALLLVLAAPSALAWGTQGHALIADIAEAHLTPTARSAVTALLAPSDTTHLDSIASIADADRSDHPETGPWHYVDIPLDAAQYNARRDCAHDDCVVARLAYFVRVLTDSSARHKTRRHALEYVVHLVGDIHQPLHAASHHDAGGNDVSLPYFGERTNLHRIWDSTILERALDLHMRRHFQYDHARTRAAAARLDRQITAAEARQWTHSPASRQWQPAIIGWANESHALARRIAYGKLALIQTEHRPGAYQLVAWPVVRQQLQRAGRRLAAVLNQALG